MWRCLRFCLDKLTILEWLNFHFPSSYNIHKSNSHRSSFSLVRLSCPLHIQQVIVFRIAGISIQLIHFGFLCANHEGEMTSRWTVHKFGGTSVGTADCMRKCIEIIRPITSQQRVAVVVSAMGGKPKVTDLLLDSVHAAAAGRPDESSAKLAGIHEKHRICVGDILDKSPETASQILEKITADLKDIADLLRAVSLMRIAHEQILELVSGYGEIWSATIMAAAMKQNGLPFCFLNARDVLFVSEGEFGTKVHWEESEKKLAEFIASAESTLDQSAFESDKSIPLPHLLITGYIASTLEGVATTLKRDGSDFSASIFGNLLKSTEITIWTDVSGVYSADPRKVPEAQIIPEVSYTEAIELAYFGAKVIHPKTMFPAVMAQIPIYIRNTFEPEHSGTRIFLPPAKGQLVREKCVCGFSTIDNISLLNIEGTGMIGVPGVAHRLFGALKSANVSVLFIAQASSEHSICFALREIYTAAARKAIEEAFFYELKQGHISCIREINNCSIIAAVGESMSNMPGVSGIFFGALGSAQVNVLSVAQGCDERNISAVVYSHDASRALRAVHSAFWLSSLEISIGILGTGRVGSAVIQTLLDQKKILEERFSLRVNIRAISNSSKMLLADNLNDVMRSKLQAFTPRPQSGSNSPLSALGGGGMRRTKSNVSFEDVGATMAEAGDDKVPADLDRFLEHVLAGDTSHAIIIDATNSDTVCFHHPAWLKAGAHVVTASKRGIAGSQQLHNQIFSTARKENRMYMSEVTIGASLPIRTTLHDILYSGDAVHSIVGLMSVSVGTVVTDMCEEGCSFSTALERTYRTGLFEDDVFRDLEGTEAAQKLLLLARELGFSMEVGDIDVEPLATRRPVESWTSLQDVFAAEDTKMAERVATAKARGCTLRYVQRIECSPPAELGNEASGIRGKASVRLEEVPLQSPYAMVKGAVYYFAFHTARYDQHPLVVQGPLSDSTNTASGIVGDILRIAKSLGAKDKGPVAASI